MKFKLAIADKVIVPVTGSLTDDSSRPKAYNFKLHCERLDQDAISDVFSAKGEPYKEILDGIVFGWTDQRLVLNDDGSPADFSKEALDALFSIAGMSQVCFNAYIAAVVPKAKN